MAKKLDEQAALEVARQIDELVSTEYMVETNQGTYGAAEAARKCGTGDPAFADRNVYETVGGRRRATGPDLHQMPGRVRHLRRDALNNDRARLAELRRQLAKLSR